MIVHTYLRESAAFWIERGIKVIPGHMVDGFESWVLDIPEDHPDISNPEYISQQAQEIMKVLPELVRRRMMLPLYTIKYGKLYADIADTTGKQGMPFARNPIVLHKLLATLDGEPHKNRVQKLTSKAQLLRVLREATQQGTESLLYFVRGVICETVPIATVLTLLQNPVAPPAQTKTTSS